MTHTISKSDRLIDAARNGRTEDVRQLMKGCPRDQRNSALRRAAEYGHMECVQALIPVCDPKHWDSDALRLAALGGYEKCVELLIPVSEPATDHSAALVAAVMNGYLECVKLLIPVSNPKDDNSLPLQWACQNNDQACFDLLYPISDPHAALQNLARDPERPVQNMLLLNERIEREQQRERLDQAVGGKSKGNTARKI